MPYRTKAKYSAWDPVAKARDGSTPFAEQKSKE
jgi:hypothetical protein